MINLMDNTVENTVIDPKFISDVRKYGHFDVEACFNCGTCAAICALAKDNAMFPRKSMRYVQLGLRKPLLGSLDPWLCYYCGDCSTSCPRQTEPGESMMTLRRFLTSQYDWTGLAKKFYLSKTWELGALFAVGAFMLALIAFFHGPMVTERVELNTFAPVTYVHIFDLVMAFVLSFFLLSNAFRMYWFTMHQERKFSVKDIVKGFLEDGFGAVMMEGGKIKVSLISYVFEAVQGAFQASTQLQFQKCGDNTGRWLKHLLLFSGYILMFSLVVVFLPWFQTDNIYPIYHPQRWLGYYATVVLVVFTVEILVGRIRKLEQIHKFSDFSDWLFPILLLLTTLTGIATHVFRYMGLPLTTYYTYAVHLIVAVPMLVVEVPFGKWAHIAYRPLAFYLQSVRENALLRHLKEDAAGVGNIEGKAPQAV